MDQSQKTSPRSLSGSSLGQHLFTPNTHIPADQRLKREALNQERIQWTRGCSTSPPSKRKQTWLFYFCCAGLIALPSPLCFSVIRGDINQGPNSQAFSVPIIAWTTLAMQESFIYFFKPGWDVLYFICSFCFVLILACLHPLFSARIFLLCFPVAPFGPSG